MEGSAVRDLVPHVEGELLGLITERCFEVEGEVLEQDGALRQPELCTILSTSTVSVGVEG